MLAPISSQLPNSATCEQLIADGVALGQHKEFTAAIAKLSLAAELFPQSADAHFNLGIAARGTSENQAAAMAFAKAVQLKPDWPEAHFNLGNTLRDLGHSNEAAAALRQALALRPGYLKALNNLANLEITAGRLKQAEKLLEQAITLDSGYAEAHYNRARALRRLKRPLEAIDSVEKALQLRPGTSRYQTKLASLLKQQGNTDGARRQYEAILTTDPLNLDALVPLAGLLHEAKQTSRALDLLDAAVLHRRLNCELLWLRADIRRSLGRFDDALDDLAEAAKISPDNASVPNLMGIVYSAKGMPEQAIICHQRAIAINPASADAYNNLGAALQTTTKYAECVCSLNTALALSPDFALAHLNRSLSRLRDGDSDEGWREFEWRFLCPSYRMPASSTPRWVGGSLAGKTILLRAEQGLGDTFQFLRYAPRLQALGARVVVECQSAAARLAATCPGVAQVVKRDERLPEVDVQSPLMSLPLWLGGDEATLPSEVPYLSAEPERVQSWRSRLAHLGAKFVVAIAWQGNKQYPGDHLRSAPLEQFRAIANIPGVALVSLQKNDGAEQLAGVDFPVHSFAGDLDRDGPFRDTAVIMEVADLVISTDTSIAHLSGALGRPTWVALPQNADWRWGVGRSDSPWYPTMRLFRQQVFQAWQAPFEAMRCEVHRMLTGADGDGVAKESSSQTTINTHAAFAACTAAIAARAFDSALVLSSPSADTLERARSTARILGDSQKVDSKLRAGIVIGHFDGPEFIDLNLAAIQSHCGDVPVLIGDDASPGFAAAPLEGSSFQRLCAVAGSHPTAALWTNRERSGHVRGDLLALAKGIVWAAELGLDVLVKLSQRLIFDRPNWLAEASTQLLGSDCAVLGVGCTQFEWKLRTESFGIRVAEWNQPEVLAALLAVPNRPFAEEAVWEIVAQHFGGRVAPWNLPAPSRGERREQVYFRATHSAEEYLALARRLKRPTSPGSFRCGASELQASYVP